MPRPATLRVAGSDAELAKWVEADRHASYAVAAGDVFRAIGGAAVTGDLHRLPCDAIEVQLDRGPAVIAVAHVVARHRWWRGAILAVMNCDHIGAWNVAPRAHPNDGRFDVVEVAAEMSARARWQARSRVRLGTHVPHPDISVRSARQLSINFERATPVWIDGVLVRKVSQLDVTIKPDWFALHV